MLEDMVLHAEQQMEELENDTSEISEEQREINDNSIFTIEKHQGAVFCVETYNNLIATGGEDDKTCMWSINEIEDVDNPKIDLYYESEKFKDSVVSIKFSHDGKFLASSDMSGNLSVIDVVKRSVYWNYELGMDTELITWHPQCNILFTGSSDGNFCMFKLSTNEIRIMFNGDDQSKVNAIRILPDGKRAACIYSNGSILIWNLKEASIEHNFKSLHKDDVICMDVHEDAHLIASGGIDMKINIVNLSSYKLITTLHCPIDTTQLDRIDDDSTQDSVEIVSFSKTLPYLICATLNGQIIVWDTNAFSVRNRIQHTHGYSKLIWHSNNQHNFYISSLDGCVYEYDCRNLSLVNKFEGHSSDILDFCISKNFKYLFTASDDHKVKIFSLK